jgi:hypothetical protein
MAAHKTPKHVPPKGWRGWRGAAMLLMMIGAGVFLLAKEATAPRFYPDDPLWEMPAPIPVREAAFRKLSEYYEFLVYPFLPPGELNGRKHPETGTRVYYRAEGVNTLGEVPDNSWYENRNYYRRMSKEAIQSGPGDARPPNMNGPWTVRSGKNEGVTPGFRIEDSEGMLYLLKFDPLKYTDLATAPDALVARLFYALGYHVPENYIVYFDADQLAISDKTKFIGPDGKARSMTRRDVTEILLKVPQSKEGKYRATASRLLPGEALGPHRYFGVRADDPNDIYPHEHRRDQRGLWVHSAWLGHDDSRGVNSLDMLTEEEGVPYVKHYLIDFGSTLGSASVRPNSPRSGNYLFSWREIGSQMFTLGLYVPGWAKANYPDLPSVGRFEWEQFDPLEWRPEYPNPAFENALPDDTFWAAKQVMALSDEQIRWAVETGEYSNPAAAEWVIECLVKRRDKIGRAFFDRVLPLDRFRVTGQELAFDDLGAMHGFYSPRTYRIRWNHFDNLRNVSTPLAGWEGRTLPAVAGEMGDGAFLMAHIAGNDPEKDIEVYLRKQRGSWEAVGVERGWVGKKELRFADEQTQ